MPNLVDDEVAPSGANATQRPPLGVIDELRQRIFRGHLVPGQRLVEAELSEVLNASRGTVRNALMDLVHEGLVERIANRGARVRIVSLEEALQIAEVRLSVERLCVRRAAERITDEEIGSLRAMLVCMKARAAAGDVFGFGDSTSELFEAYVAIADHPVAAETLERLRSRNARHRFRLTYRPERAKIALPYWIDLIEAICSRHPDAAVQALERHAANAQEGMRAVAQDEWPFAMPPGQRVGSGKH